LDAVLASRIPAPTESTPAISDGPAVSPRVKAEMRMPRLGTAGSAIDSVLHERHEADDFDNKTEGNVFQPAAAAPRISQV